MAEPFNLEAARAYQENLPWSYDENGQAFEFVEPDKYAAALAEIERLRKKNDRVDAVARLAAVEKKVMLALESYRTQYTIDAEDNGLELADLLSPMDTVEEGRKEMALLADHIAAAIAAPAPEVKPEPCGECASCRGTGSSYRGLSGDAMPCPTCHGTGEVSCTCSSPHSGSCACAPRDKNKGED